MDPPPTHLTIQNAQFPGDQDDDEMVDPTYEPSIHTSSDQSMGTSSSSGLSDPSATGQDPDVDIRSQTVSTSNMFKQTTGASSVAPEDSASVRFGQRRTLVRLWNTRGADAAHVQEEGSQAAEGAAAGPDNQSVFSIHSSGECPPNVADIPRRWAVGTGGLQLFKTLYGRSFNAQSDDYMMPADDMEHARLDIQHYVLRAHLGSLYHRADLVEHALRADQDPPPEILDIGSGSGRWALDMAQEFPHAKVIGLDLIPPANLDESVIPPNCRFEVDDANLSMVHYANTFTVVHCRACQTGINDFESFLYQVAMTLKPGGILLLSSGYPFVYDESLQVLPDRTIGEPGFSWVHHVLSESYRAYLNRDATGVDAKVYWADWLRNNPNYRDVQELDIYVPIGPWKNNLNASEQWAAWYMRENICRITHSLKPLLMTNGATQDEVDMWAENAIQELQDLAIHGHLRWRYTTAIRTDDPWQERSLRPPVVVDQA